MNNILILWHTYFGMVGKILGYGVDDPSSNLTNYKLRLEIMAFNESHIKIYTHGLKVALEITLGTVENDRYHRENRAHRHVWQKSRTGRVTVNVTFRTT